VQTKAIIDRMLWFSRREVKGVLPHIMAELTVQPESKFVYPQPFCLMEEGVNWIGVPRAWGLKQRWLVGQRSIEDRTVYPIKKWPPFVGEYRAGQQASVEAIVSAFMVGQYGALLDAKTGTGKTAMSAVIASTLNTPTLVVVHKEDLADQWRGVVENQELFVGVDTGHVQGSHWDYQNKHLVTAMAQTLYSRVGMEPTDFYKSFGLVIFDECHRYPARTFETVLKLPYARYRLGVSATWRRRDGLECIWHWHIGAIEHRTAGVHLVGEYVQVPWNTQVGDWMAPSYGGKVCHAKILNIIAANAPYNEWLTGELIKGAQANRQMLLCSHRVAQLVDIKTRIERKNTGLSVGYYVGAIDKKALRSKELEASKKCNIILATYHKMSEGTDIDTLDTLILATPAVDIEQVVGRIQRPKIGKQPLLVVDPVWQTPYNLRLAEKRKVFYKKLNFTKQGG